MTESKNPCAITRETITRELIVEAEMAREQRRDVRPLGPEALAGLVCNPFDLKCLPLDRHVRRADRILLTMLKHGQVRTVTGLDGRRGYASPGKRAAEVRIVEAV